MTGDRRLVRALLACYPTGWRHRYGEEYAQLLCDLRVHRRPALIVDSLRGAVRAHGGVLMSGTAPMSVVVWAAGLFTVAGIGFAKLAEDVTGQARGPYALLVAGAALALLALTAAALPAAASLWRARDTGAATLLAVPVAGAAGWYAAVRLALATSAGHGVHSAANVAGFVLVAASTTAVVAATAWAVTRVLRRARAAQPGRLQRLSVAVTAGGMAVATAAAVGWGLQVRTGDPAEFRASHGFLATPFVPSWIAVVVALAVSTTLTALAGRRRPASHG